MKEKVQHMKLTGLGINRIFTNISIYHYSVELLTCKRASGIHIPEGFPGFTTVTNLGDAFPSFGDRTFSSQSIKEIYTAE